MSRNNERDERDRNWRSREQNRQGDNRWPEGEDYAREQQIGGTRWRRPSMQDEWNRGSEREVWESDGGQRVGWQGDRWQGRRESQFRGDESNYGRGWNQNMGGWNQGQEMRRENERQYVGRGPRGYKRSDSRIEEDVNERLTQHGMIDATDIEVSVQNGEVTLRGYVDRRMAKRLAEDIADSVFAVKEVHNQIKVKQTDEGDKRNNETESGVRERDRKAG